jgi:uncharacterized protein (DUF2249 family)
MKAAAARTFRALDVRPILERGGDALQKILATLASLRTNEGLALTSPFLPSPLIERLQAQGFAARPERRSDGSWRTLFWME